MSRLPTDGGDSGGWGTVLNDFLGVGHTTDGQLRTRHPGQAVIEPGLWYSNALTGQVGYATTTATANRLYLFPQWLPFTTTVDAVACKHTNLSGAGGVVRIGLYSPNGSYRKPSTLLWDAGTAPLDSIGDHIISTTNTIPAGLSWWGLWTSVAVGYQSCGTTMMTAATGAETIAANSTLFYYVAGNDYSAGLPTTLPTIAMTGVTGVACPAVFFRPTAVAVT